MSKGLIIAGVLGGFVLLAEVFNLIDSISRLSWTKDTAKKNKEELNKLRKENREKDLDYWSKIAFEHVSPKQ